MREARALRGVSNHNRGSEGSGKKGGELKGTKLRRSLNSSRSVHSLRRRREAIIHLCVVVSQPRFGFTERNSSIPLPSSARPPTPFIQDVCWRFCINPQQGYTKIHHMRTTFFQLSSSVQSSSESPPQLPPPKVFLFFPSGPFCTAQRSSFL